MEIPLQILAIEDNPTELLEVQRHLETQGLPAQWRRVASASGLEAAIQSQPWDVVLTEHAVTGLDFADILRLLKPFLERLPLLLVSRRFDEQRAVQELDRGVWDYVFKDDLLRLVPAIRRAVKDAENRRARQDAEAALRQRSELQDQLAKVADSVPGLICSFQLRPDGSACMPFATPAIIDIYGLQPEAVKEDFSPILDLVLPEDREYLQQTIGESARTMTPWHGVFRARHPQKGVIWIEGHSVPRQEPDGSILWHGFVQDVTESKRAEAMLREREELLREMGRMAQIGGWEFDALTGEGRWTEEVARIHDLAPDVQPNKELGLTFYEGNSRDQIARAVEQAIAHGTPYDLELQFVSTKGIRKWVRTMGQPEVKDGRVVKLRGALQDITGRKRTEEALAAEAARRRILIEGSRDGIVVLDQNGKVFEANRRFAEMLGYSAEEIRQLHVWDWDRDWPRERVLETIRALGPEGARFESRHWRKDGSFFEVDLSSSVAELDGQRLVFCVCHDITERKQAAEDLRESEDRYRLLVEESPEAIGIYQGDQLVFVNTTAVRMLGGKVKTDLLGLRSAQIIHPDDLAAARERTRRRLAGDTNVYPAEVRYVRLDGAVVPVEVSAAPVQFAGKPAMQFLARDISERKQREELNRLHLHALELLSADAPLREVLGAIVALLESGHEGWRGSIMLVDGMGTHLFCGAAPRLPQFYLEAISAVPIQSGFGSCGTAAATKKMVMVEDIATHPFWTDYREIALRAGLRACWSIPVLSAQGDILATLAVYHGQPSIPTPEELKSIQGVIDLAGVAVRKLRAEEALREREEVFSSIVSQAADAIAVVDADTGRFVEFNTAACEGLGYSREEFANFGLGDIQARYSLEDIQHNIATARQMGGINFESKHLHRDGSLRDVRVGIRPLRIRKRDYLAVVWTDITERMRLESQLRQSQKLEAIGQLAGGVAHDFNNILAAILMQLGLLQMNPALDPETSQAVTELESEARRAASLTRQLLMFSRRSVLEVKPLDLNDVVRDLLKMLGRLISEQIRLSLEGFTGPLPRVAADAGMLEQVLMNLVVNARDAMPGGGRITISTGVEELNEESASHNADRRPGRFVLLSVSDTGAGMKQEILERIFEPFFTTKEPGKGTGLGLATVHGIVAQHKGWVEVASEVGKGTTFRVFLPAATETAVSPSTELPKVPLQRGRETLLLVEDEPNVRRTVGQTLRALGYQVYEAENGQQAMILWQKHGAGVDLLISDMVMPEGITGLELAERLQTDRPSLRVIISSGYSSEIFHAGGIKNEGIWYLPKPYEAKTLAETVRNCLDRKS